MYFIRHVHEHVLPSPPSLHVHLFSLIMTLGHLHLSFTVFHYLLSLQMFGEPCSLFTAPGILSKHMLHFSYCPIWLLDQLFLSFHYLLPLFSKTLPFLYFSFGKFSLNSGGYIFIHFFKNNNVTTIWFPFQKYYPAYSFHCFIFHIRP